MAAERGEVTDVEVRAAQAHFEQALAHQPSEWRAYAGLGRLATMQQSDREAVAHWMQAAALAAEDPLVAYQLGLAWEAAGDHERALAAWRLARAEVRFTTEGAYWERLKDVWAAQGRYRLALEVAPDWGPAWSGLGRVYHFELGRAALEAGDPEEAEYQLRTAVELDPAFSKGYYLLGQAFLQQGRLPEAEGALLEAVRLEPGHAWSHAGLGDVYTAWGRTGEAQRAYQQAVVLFEQILKKGTADPSDVWKGLGDAQGALGRWDAALSAYWRAIYEDPVNPRAHAQAGDALCQLERPEEALGYYQRAFLLGNRSPRVRRAIRAIIRTGTCSSGG